jgi:hypothetical protein
VTTSDQGILRSPRGGTFHKDYTWLPVHDVSRAIRPGQLVKPAGADAGTPSGLIPAESPGVVRTAPVAGGSGALPAVTAPGDR